MSGEDQDVGIGCVLKIYAGDEGDNDMRFSFEEKGKNETMVANVINIILQDELFDKDSSGLVYHVPENLQSRRNLATRELVKKILELLNQNQEFEHTVTSMKQKIFRKRGFTIDKLTKTYTCEISIAQLARRLRC